MLNLLPLLALVAVAATPASAQPVAEPAAAEKPKTVIKEVCTRVKEEVSTGMLVAKTRKVCKKVEVPVDPQASEAKGQGHGAHAS